MSRRPDRSAPPPGLAVARLLLALLGALAGLASLASVAWGDTTVGFDNLAPGTRVTIKGRASRRIRDALLLLGEPEQWPQRRPAG